MKPLERHYSSGEAARFIGLSSGYLRNLRVRGKGPRWKVVVDGTEEDGTESRRVIYAESALCEYLEQKAEASS